MAYTHRKVANLRIQGVTEGTEGWRLERCPWYGTHKMQNKRNNGLTIGVHLVYECVTVRKAEVADTFIPKKCVDEVQRVDDWLQTMWAKAEFILEGLFERGQIDDVLEAPGNLPISKGCDEPQFSEIPLERRGKLILESQRSRLLTNSVAEKHKLICGQDRRCIGVGQRCRPL